MIHTNEPWHQGFVTSVGTNICAPVSGKVIATVNCIEDAHRIIACVNTCAGLTTEDVESIPLPIAKLASDYRAMKLGRDELLSELKYARSNGIFATFITDRFDAVIAKMESA